ncbi:hypothetical protein ARMSODRAFT_1027954 [Armillaria solidipes]|uniref:DUF6534 domain-containing protein n=1 Tax=Armillaria solidipes TaxID=1076256 RepID=A0A2H3B2J3_9AGAR|nr:hypothetical protein ARMSODRAFT_1027954 [Armillaria solidipes]
MQPVPTGIPIERVSGPLIVGYLLHWGLFGTLSVQLYLYYLAFPKDGQFIKCLVYGIYIVEFVQTILVAHDAFVMFGYDFGDLEALTGMHFNWLIVPIMTAIPACVGQGFYSYRIFVLSRSRTVPALVSCVSLTSSVAAIITSVYSFQAGNITKLNNRKTSIVVGLTRHNASFRQTQILVTKIIRLTIETGSVTAVVALLTLILFFAFPHELFYRTAAIIMPKLYTNTVYMVLNSRIRIMGGRDTYTSSTDMEITTTMMRDITSHLTQGAQRAHGVHGQVSEGVPITRAVFSSDHEMGRMSVSHVT